MEEDNKELIQNSEKSYVEPQSESDEIIEKRTHMWEDRLLNAARVQK